MNTEEIKLRLAAIRGGGREVSEELTDIIAEVLDKQGPLIIENATLSGHDIACVDAAKIFEAVKAGRPISLKVTKNDSTYYFTNIFDQNGLYTVGTEEGDMVLYSIYDPS